MGRAQPADRHGFTLPKGSSPTIEGAARERPRSWQLSGGRACDAGLDAAHGARDPARHAARLALALAPGGFVEHFLERASRAPTRWPPDAAAAMPVADRANENVYRRARDGHFYVDADVNGARIRFLVDTGATYRGAVARRRSLGGPPGLRLRLHRSEQHRQRRDPRRARDAAGRSSSISCSCSTCARWSWRNRCRSRSSA